MVTSVNELRPTSVAGLVLAAGPVGTAGASFFIKVNSAIMDHRTRIADTSGDGDLAPRWSANYWLYVDWLIRGWVVSGQALGIANLIVTANNPTGTTLVQFHLGKDSSNRVVKGEFLVHRVKIAWERKAAFIGLAIALKNTATNADGLANYVEGT